MGAVRATVLLAAAAFLALPGAAPALAFEPQTTAGTADGAVAPVVEPAVELSAPAATPPAQASAEPAKASAEPAQASAESAPEPIPAPPETAAVAPPEPPSTASTPEATLPEIPGAPVTISGADRLPGALAARFADAQGSLHPRLSRKERDAMGAFYALGAYQPLWIANGAWNAAGQAVIERLKGAHEDGLNAAEYPIPALMELSGGEREAVEAELKLSAAAVVYARDARGGRIEPSRLSSLITPDLDLPAADAVLTALGASKNAGAALAAYHPPHAGYAALKAKLSEVRAGAEPQARLEGDLVANMERWRWLPSDMGRRHVFVNIPEFKLRLMADGRAIHEARVIVGKPETPTPLFSDEMDHAVVNPSWYVPPSIFKNEFHSDPAFAAARGYDVVQSKNGGISIRQPPGERNALGFVKFMFPNKHAVYLHDTPNRRLFAAEKRAMSHGCVRLDQPFRFGEFVLGSEWTEPRLRSLIGRGERSIRLPEKIQVHLAYFTAQVDDTGELRQFADLYGINNKVRAALNLPRDGMPVAEARSPRKVASTQPTRAQTGRPPRAQTAEVRRRPARPVRTAGRAPVAAPQAEPHPFFWWFR